MSKKLVLALVVAAALAWYLSCPTCRRLSSGKAYRADPAYDDAGY